MYSFFYDFKSGIMSALNGIREFFSHRELWKYAAFPLGIVLAVYILLGVLGYWLLKIACNFLDQTCSELPEYLQWLSTAGGGLAGIALLILFWLIIVLSVGTLYELFGGLFFDTLIEKYSVNGGFSSQHSNSRGFELRAVVDSCLYSLNTLLILLGTFLLDLLLPVVGPVISLLIISYRLGVSYLAIIGFRYGRYLYMTRQMTRLNMASTLGYGIAIYLLFTLPLAVLVFLPGLITGGVLLYNRMLENERKV